MLASSTSCNGCIKALSFLVVFVFASFQTETLRAEEEKVLRHAVFFKFKETASEADVQKVVEAFAALPDKIDSIIDFEWGERSSGDGISGGFTHCFLLTFKNEAGREKYLPHPDHKAFGAMLGPHLDDVFVIDYWGKKVEKAPSKALRHGVFFKFKKDAAQADIDQALKAFAGLPGEINTIKGFEWGTNNSPESHDDGFTHAFLVTFESQNDLEAYGPHEAHQALVKLLPPILEEVRVLDYWKK
jgi:hypothetical protein